MTTFAVLWFWLAGMPGLANTSQVSTALERLGDADLVLMTNPAGPKPVHILVASQVAVPADKLRQVLADADSYRKAMPAFRRTDVVSRRERAPGVADQEIAWELEIPTWNLTGKLWLCPRPEGMDLELAEGDLAPGLFHLKAIPLPPPPAGKGGGAVKPERSILTIDGYANLADVNWATRKMVRRSPLVEPVMTAGALYVMLRSLVSLAERGAGVRPAGPMAAADLSSLQGTPTGRVASAFAVEPKVLAVIRRRTDGRLARVEVAVSALTDPEDAAGKSLLPETFRELPGWKKVTAVHEHPDECKQPAATCWKVEADLPFASVGGIWQLSPQPWRARMVDGDTKGAVLGLDFLPSPSKGRTTVVVSQHPRLDQAGFLPRKLIEAEPLMEHALALSLTIVDALTLLPALEKL